MPKYIFDRTHIRLGVEDEFHNVVRTSDPQNAAIGYGTFLLVSKESQYGFPLLSFTTDHPGKRGKNTAELEIITAPLTESGLKKRLPQIKQALQKAVQAGGTLGNVMNQFNTSMLVRGKNGAKWKLAPVADTDFLKVLKTKLKLKKWENGAWIKKKCINKVKLISGKLNFNNRQVNVSLPFVSIGNSKSEIFQSKWASSVARKKYDGALKIANSLVDNHLKTKRKLRKVRSLLTLYFFNILVQMGARKMLNKDSWYFLPKISIDDALDIILTKQDKLEMNKMANSMFQLSKKNAFKSFIYPQMQKIIADEKSLKRYKLKIENQIKKLLNANFIEHEIRIGKKEDDTFILGDTLTGKSITPYHVSTEIQKKAVSTHKASDYMVVFEIRKIGSDPKEFAYPFKWK